ncbi:MAG: hypothetical protein K6G29_10945 [Clostridiales bacterium]|nr:hypothetical protein [Clostridiales bacterium]
MEQKKTPFEEALCEKFARPAISARTDVRWWMASGLHTDETIREELRAMHDAGFGGVELCQLADRHVDETLYGYGSRQWENDVKLILNTALDCGMSVSLTSGAGWSTANVPGLDPDSQEANQCVVLLTEDLDAASTRRGALPRNERLREKAVFVGAAAIRKAGEDLYDPHSAVNLTPLVKEGCLEWTAPAEPAQGKWTLMFYYAQGTAQAVSPAAEKSYTINYFDRRGVEALKKYLERDVLNDEALNEKIRAGDVQFFMDSLEYNTGAGITSWTENFEERFRAMKGYDVLPWLFLAADAPNTSIWNWEDNADLEGRYTLTDRELGKRILNDIYNVQTKLYMEEFIAPFSSWLHTRGMTLRAQISYGKNLEISEPIAVVDRPEAENRNQKNQADMYRLWSGGAHLQNKVLSAETGGLDNSNYSYTLQRHLQEAYVLYSVGFSRIVWHIWAARFGPTPVWPGYEGGNGMDIFYKFGTREPSYSDYALLNDHIGRVQSFLREGRPGVDLGMPYVKYGQHMVYGNEKDWLHEHEPMFFPSTAAQDSGYTYDYFYPGLLEGTSFDRLTGTLEPAGYRALVLWQADLPVKGAKRILAFAEEGLPVILIDGAAVSSPYQGDSPEELRRITGRLEALPNFRAVSAADGVSDALREMGIVPRIGFAAPNRQLLTQVRRTGKDGRDLFVYVYNYCDGSLHGDGCVPHVDSIETELTADGSFIPYAIDPWNGKLKKSPARIEGGKTHFPVSMRAGDIALFALETVEEAERLISGDPAIRTLPPREITGWDLTVEAWSPSDEIETRTEILLDLTTNEYAVKTEKREIRVFLDRLVPWDRIEAVGRAVSGKGFYRAEFRWGEETETPTPDGAILDFGSMTESVRVWINGRETDPVNMNVPRVDITSLLRPGRNTVEVEYSSNLNNLQLARGKVRENILVNRFRGYRTGYESYGLRQAVLIPYNEE